MTRINNDGLDSIRWIQTIIKKNKKSRKKDLSKERGRGNINRQSNQGRRRPLKTEQNTSNNFDRKKEKLRKKETKVRRQKRVKEKQL